MKNLSMKLLYLFTVGYLAVGGWHFLRQGDIEFVGYVGVIVVIFGLVLWAQPALRLSVPLLWGLSFWGLLHVLGGAVVIDGHVLFAHRIFPLVDLGGDFYILKYDQVVHGYLFGLVGVIALHVLREVWQVRRPAFLVAFAAVLISLGISSLNEIMEFIITITVPENGVGGYDNTMLDFVFNFSGAVVVVAGVYVWECLKARK